MNENRDMEKSDSLSVRRGAQGSRRGVQRPGVPCAELTALALSQLESVGSRGRGDVIRNDVTRNDVTTESGVCGPFNIQQSTDKPKQHFLT